MKGGQQKNILQSWTLTGIKIYILSILKKKNCFIFTDNFKKIEKNKFFEKQKI